MGAIFKRLLDREIMSDEITPSSSFTEKLVAYLDGELPEGDARDVESSLASDPAMRAEVEKLNRAWELLDLLPRPNASGEFSSRTLTTLKVSGATTALPNESAAAPTVALKLSKPSRIGNSTIAGQRTLHIARVTLRQFAVEVRDQLLSEGR